MKTTILGLLVLASGIFPKTLSAHEHTQSSVVDLTVSLFNDAGVEPSVWLQAQGRATEIMRRSGISLTWLDCGSPVSPMPDPNCSAISYPTHLSVRVVPKVSPVKGHIFGQTFQDAAGEGNYATTVPAGELLGCVVAHELGHLLLGTASHSSTGLMSAVWQDPELQQVVRGNLFFSGGEGERMRSRYAVAGARLRKLSEPRVFEFGKVIPSSAKPHYRAALLVAAPEPSFKF
jgi:hypothetical protein